MERRGFHLRCLRGAAIGLGVGLLVAVGAWLGVFRGIDAVTLDWLFRLRGPRATHGHIVIVNTDDGSEAPPGPRPPSARQCLELLQCVGGARALVIGFAEPLATASATPAAARDTALLAEAIARTPNVVLGLPHRRISAPSHLQRSPPAALVAEARTVGHTVLDADADGVVRRVPLVVTHPDGREVAFGLQVVAAALGISRDEPVVVTDAARAAAYGLLRIPVARGGRMLINYVGPAQTFHTVPATRLLSEPVLAQNYSGKIVLIGSLSDTVRTPYARADEGPMPRVELHANVVATIMNAAFLAEAGPLACVGGIVLLGVLLGAAVPNLRTSDKAVLTLGLLALAVGLALLLFAYGGFFLRVVPLLTVLGLTYVAVSLHELWRANALINAEMQTLLSDGHIAGAGDYECSDAPLLAAMSSLAATLRVAAFSLSVPGFRDKGNVIAYRHGTEPRARGAYLSRLDAGVWEAIHSGQAVLIDSPHDSVTAALELDGACQRAVYIPLSNNGDVEAVLGLYQQDAEPLTDEQLLIAAEAMEQALAARMRNDLYDNVRGGPESGPFSDQNLERRLAALSAIRTTTAEQRAAAEAVLASVSDGVVMFDVAGRPMTWNPTALEMIGTTDEDLSQNSFVPFMTDTARLTPQRASEMLVELFARADTSSAEVDMAATGRSCLITANRVPADLEKKPIGIVVTIVDVTDFKAAARMKDELMSIATHELRTPLTAILGYAELLNDGPVDNETLGRSADVILRQAAHLSSMIDGFLDISRLESGREELNLERVDVPGLARGCLHALRPTAAAKSIVMRAHQLGNCPPALADRRQIERVMNNLVGNAIKYSPEGSEVDVVVQAQNGQIKVSVTDTGRGIDKDELSHIFEKFYRGRGPSMGEVRGTGLGLSLVKLIVESHGGEVGVESEPGEGSTFSFTLPVAGGYRHYAP